MIDLAALRELLAFNESRRWYPRGRHISLRPDDSGMGARLHTNHVANFANKETCSLAVAAVNALPQLLDELERLRAVERSYDDYERMMKRHADALNAVDAARKAGT